MFEYRPIRLELSPEEEVVASMHIDVIRYATCLPSPMYCSNDVIILSVICDLLN